MYIRKLSLKPFYNVLSYALYCMPFLYTFGNTALANCGLGVEGVVSQAASCGESNGKASLILNGGVAPFTYAWSNGATTAIATGLAAGFHTVTVTDANACTVIKTIAVSNTDAPQILNAAAGAATCQNNNGTYSFSVAGASTYDVAWTGPTTGTLTSVVGVATLSNLVAGTYDLVVSANGCATYATFLITSSNNIPMQTAVVQSPACNNGTNGILRGTAMAGSLPFEFFINGVSQGQVFSNNFDFAALAAGTYELYVKDGNGCVSIPTYVNLNEATAPALNINQFVVTNATCAGAYTGSVTLATGTTGTYELFTTDNILIGTLPQNAVGAGNYKIRYVDGTCQSFLPIRITEPSTWQVAANVSNPTCTPGAATISLNIIGGTAPYTYAWSTGATTATLSNAVSDFYSVSITDAQGCTFISDNILVRNCSSIETIYVNAGSTITHCVDTTDVAGAAATVLNICPSLAILGTVNSIALDGCIEYTAGIAMGVDTICVQVCNADNSVCDTTRVLVHITSPVDTLRNTGAINTTQTLCPDLSVFVNPIAQITNISSQPLYFGTMNLNTTTGCVDYTNTGVMGNDTITVAICDALGFCDTTAMIFTSVSLADTIVFNVSATTEGTYCPDLSVFATNIDQVINLNCSTIGNGIINNINTANGCVRYQAGNWVATDTVCVQVCDTRGFCDTTVVVFNIVPHPDTVIIDLLPGAAPVDTCLYNIQFTTPVATVTDLGCATGLVGVANINTTTGCINYTAPIPVPGSGTRTDMICLVACDGNGVCDTVTYIFNNIEPTCGGAVPDIISRQVQDCNAVTVDVCLPIPVDSLATYQVFLDGTAYTGATTGCAFVTKVQYPFVLVPTNCNNDFILDWTVNGQQFGPAQVTGIAGVVAQLSLWDPQTAWTVNNNIITGISAGSDSINYSNLIVTCPQSTGAPTVLGPSTQQQYANGTQISLTSIGHYQLTVVDRYGCVDTSLLRVECVNPSYVVDTIYLDSTTVDCNVDYTQIQSIDATTIGCIAQGNVAVALDANGCVEISGLVLGVDSFCVVTCDTFGICDTTYFTYHVMLPMPVAVVDSGVVQFATASVSIDLCANDEIPNAAYDINILVNPRLGTLSNNGCVWTYTRRSADVCGVDSFQYEIRNATGASSAWVYIDVECLPFSISEGLSPNGDGYNDRFIINNLADYPNHELFIFNRWGKLVYKAKNYANDWEGTYNGDLLPDGTYFYILEMNNDRDEVFKGFFIINR